MAQSTILVLLGALWLCFLVLAAVVWAMLRQIGVLYERVAPVGALMDSGGPKVGEASPTMRLPSLNGGGVVVGPGRGRAQLLFFLSTSCPVCKQLLPVLDSVRKDEGHWLDVVLASDGEEATHQAFISRRRLGDFAYVLSTELGMAYRVQRLPFGVVLDGDGVVRAKGLINNREQLESLFHALEAGAASVQQLAKQRALAFV
ncbi:MAG: methylamine dehydrogenase accessory protein MauD [Phenylobacterium sp. RIFCSPHIGHO2_01_FULL_69_31]|uniref:methylamine dehydrogenase accessory protein MauD n=1 Tax=unclassified Phenylobacterium TaxID=2640670 RepID=UPI0008B1D7D7|nr:MULTISPECIES: methylamine dehydrogenase accessory protein MauD [unclassified Phenylobacterium]OHB26870.1 MAG: methylamine dehydrogenase accessory protein MauD [Phenylobacterium sp. RIFCSPHIGHO2_01_FULL_69_31]TAJ69373.1 MAG: methylamine dehydrogenase accessory protein MauD [Phenylobacterium sp.]